MGEDINLTIETKEGADIREADQSILQCISEDINMFRGAGKGVAQELCDKFGGVSQLEKQSITTGGLAFMKQGAQYIIYLVTKKRLWHRPSPKAMESCLTSLRDFCLKNKITQLAVPTQGDKLDKWTWPIVVEIIKKLFNEKGKAPRKMKITVYAAVLTPEEQQKKEEKWKEIEKNRQAKRANKLEIEKRVQAKLAKKKEIERLQVEKQKRREAHKNAVAKKALNIAAEATTNGADKTTTNGANKTTTNGANKPAPTNGAAKPEQPQKGNKKKKNTPTKRKAEQDISAKVEKKVKQ